MKRHPFCIWLLPFATLVCTAQSQHGESAKTALPQKLWELQQRIDRKDYTAFSDATDLPGPVGVSFIWSYAHSDGADPQTRPKALEAIKRTHGFKDYMQKKIAALTDRERDPSNEVRILTAIGSREAAEVLAPYLFDYRYPHSGQYMDGPIYNKLAARALGQMHFADAPIPDAWGGYGPEKLIAWQKWAIAHEMVPKEWDARVGIPEWQLKLAALDERLRRPAEKKGERKAEDPSDAKRVLPPSQGDKPTSLLETGASKPSASRPDLFPGGWALWAGIAAVLAAAAAGWLLLRGRGRKA